MSPEELERRREAWLDKADDERIARPARLRQVVMILHL